MKLLIVSTKQRLADYNGIYKLQHFIWQSSFKPTKTGSGSNRMLIAVDAAGGDYAPREIVKGAVEAVDQYDVHIALVGRKTVLDMLVRHYKKKRNLSIIEASQVIGYNEHPVQAIRSKPDSSIVVGINLLREGLDLPEVSLVAILDADKEGFLRSEGSLIQTMGRAARHVDGQVIMYADTTTNSMQAAIKETQRRCQIQEAYNREHGITPQGIRKAIRDITERVRAVAETRAPYVAAAPVTKEDVARLIKELETQMKAAARSLEFEKAALLRDRIIELRKEFDYAEIKK